MYTTSDFVAVTDADVVLHTYVDEELLFDGDGRPSVFGHNYMCDTCHAHGWYAYVLYALKLPWMAEFMHALPMVFNRSHLPFIRDFVRSRIAPHGSFSNAFTQLTFAIGKNESVAASEFSFHPCFFSLAGGIMWEYQKGYYDWHIIWFPKPSQWLFGAVRARGPLIQYRCPRHFVGTHLSNEKYFGSSEYLSVAFKVGLAAMCNIAVALSEIYGPLLQDSAVFTDSLESIREALLPYSAALGTAKDINNTCGQPELQFYRSDKYLLLLRGMWYDDESTAHFCDSGRQMIDSWNHHVARHAVKAFQLSRLQNCPQL